jgi:predicted DCC family thiol-disulfide oxidoreductase YuxK
MAIIATRYANFGSAGVMMPSVGGITIVYDADCGLCRRAKAWISQQTPFVAIQFLASGSSEARRRFPQLAADELAVVADTGEVWLGNRAWIVCLWALRGYRDLALKLTSPLLVRMAREVYMVVSRNRHALSSLLRLRSEREIEQQLRKVVVRKCQPEPK